MEEVSERRVDERDVGRALEEALAAIFGESAGVGPDEPTQPAQPPSGTVDEQVAELLQQAADAFQAADAALRRGDIVTWTEKIDEAQRAVEEAARLVAGPVGADA